MKLNLVRINCLDMIFNYFSYYVNVKQKEKDEKLSKEMIDANGSASPTCLLLQLQLIAKNMEFTERNLIPPRLLLCTPPNRERTVKKRDLRRSEAAGAS